ncbi:toxin-antitoxin system YwqK family antitoxin [Pustulibacterium marinum]|nr:nicotinic acid mononucleotide adenyltransferase [Pustulibacterium marinum]
MKRILFTLAMVFTLSGFAQQEKPILEKSGDLVKATYKNAEGVVTQQGYFKDGKLHGEWVAYDNKGNRTAVATYEDGKKVGTWLFWNNDKLSEVTYDDNAIVSVNNWVSNGTMATNP